MGTIDYEVVNNDGGALLGLFVASPITMDFMYNIHANEGDEAHIKLIIGSAYDYAIVSVWSSVKKMIIKSNHKFNHCDNSIEIGFIMPEGDVVLKIHPVFRLLARFS